MTLRSRPLVLQGGHLVPPKRNAHCAAPTKAATVLRGHSLKSPQRPSEDKCRKQQPPRGQQELLGRR